MGVNNYPFWWAMLFSGTIFGNLTLIGSTANIVAIDRMIERRKRSYYTKGMVQARSCNLYSNNDYYSVTSILAGPNYAKLKSFSILHNKDDTKYFKFTQC